MFNSFNPNEVTANKNDTEKIENPIRMMSLIGASENEKMPSSANLN